MNKFIVATVVAVMATGAVAQGVSGNQENVLGANNNYEASVDNSTSETTTTTVTHEAGSGTTTVTNNSTSYKPNGYVSNPSLTTSGQDTCFGSKSNGISGPGFGISGGETVVDQNCIMLKNAKLLNGLGLKDAAVLLLMNSNDDIAAAVWGAYPELADHLTSVSQ